jgi:N-acetylglucosamine-6-phosphate deacetylase
LRQKGRIATGLDADLVVLGPDNLVESVMARGAWHVKNREQVLSGLFED